MLHPLCPVLPITLKSTKPMTLFSVYLKDEECVSLALLNHYYLEFSLRD